MIKMILFTSLISMSLMFGQINDTTSVVVLTFSEPMMIERWVCDSTVATNNIYADSKDSCVHWHSEPVLCNPENYKLKVGGWDGEEIPIYHVAVVNKYMDWDQTIECGDSTVVALIVKKLKPNLYYQVWATNVRDRAGNLIDKNFVGFFFDAFQPDRISKPNAKVERKE